MDTENEEMASVHDPDWSFSEEESEYDGLDDDEESDFDGQYGHAISSLHGTSSEASEAKACKTHGFASQTSPHSRLRSRRRRPGGRALGYLPALGQYNDKYRALLNQVISEAAGTTFGEGPELGTSQLGASLWTGLQKELFFSALTRYGQDNLPKLAAVTEKSEPEVAHYLYLLEAGVKELSAVTNRRHSLDHEHIPAAAELSDECCESLQRVADALISLQESWEANKEQKKHGRYWLLDQAVADRIEDEVSHHPPKEAVEQERANQRNEESERQQMPPHPSQESERQSVLDSIPAARLLRLEAFIDLSETLFMNSPDPEYDCNTYVSSKQGPSIYHTAFDDFHSLTVAITRRIAHAAAFQAMTRSRAMDNRRSEPSPKQHKVRRADVEAALEILGMKKNANEYWATLPRRQGLRCYRLGSKGMDRQRWVRRWIPVDEVERYLKGEIAKLKRRYPRERAIRKAGFDGGRSTSTAKRSFGAVDDEDGEDTVQPRKRHRVEDDSLVEEAEETDHVERVDRQSSTIEERELWKMLEQTPPRTVNLEDVAVGEPAKAASAEQDSPSDWRDWFQYAPEWMQHVRKAQV